MKRKPQPYAVLLEQTRERLEAARKRLQADPENVANQESVTFLEGDVNKLERYAAQEAGK